LSNETVRKHLLVDEKVFESLLKTRPDLVKFLLPWTRSCLIVTRKEMVKVKFPTMDGQPYEATQSYDLDSRVLGNFWFHKLYTLEPDYEGFASVERFGGSNFKFELPSARSTINDGQMKIVIDAVVAVDALPSLDSQKIVCVGTSGSGTVVSGLAYEVIAQMVTNSSISMYDPREVPGVYKDGRGNTITRIREKFLYNVQEDVDLLLDDAWELGVTHEDRDPDGNSFKAKSYSIKCFDVFRYAPLRAYFQAFRTKRYEHRLVNCRRSYVYTYRPLGRCGACVELKYLLKREYPSDFYEFFMRSHSVNCIDKTTRTFGLRDLVLVDFAEVVPLSDSFLSKFFRLSWDPGFKDGGFLPLNISACRGAYVKVTNDRYLINMILMYAKCILKIEDNRMFVVGNPLDFGMIPVGDRAPDVTLSVVESHNMSRSKHRNKDVYGDRGVRKKKWRKEEKE